MYEGIQMVSHLYMYTAKMEVLTSLNGIKCPYLKIFFFNFMGTKKSLLEYGADVDAEANEIGNFVTPLFLGIEKKYLPVIQYLLDHKADVNKRQTGKNGWTPLLYATLLEDKGVIELLVKNGADCNQVCLISDTCELLNNKEKVQPVGEVCEVTPTYVAWWRNSECLATLEKRSQSTLNLSLAKKNKHKQALQYFSVQE